MRELLQSRPRRPAVVVALVALVALILALVGFATIAGAKNHSAKARADAPRSRSGASVSSPEPAGSRLVYLTRPEGRTRAVVFYLHGGGWLTSADFGQKPGANPDDPFIGWLLRHDVAVAYVEYARGAESIRSSLRAYRQVRRRFAGLPICAWGGSAGAHLALKTAVEGTDYACIVAEAPPIKIESIITHASTPAALWVSDIIRMFWPTAAERAQASLNGHERELDVPTLIGAATCDAIIPIDPTRRFVARARALGKPVSLIVGRPGEGPPFSHCGAVRQADVDRFEARRNALLKRKLDL